MQPEGAMLVRSFVLLSLGEHCKLRGYEKYKIEQFSFLKKNHVMAKVVASIKPE